jgi:hypothetical protein
MPFITTCNNINREAKHRRTFLTIHTANSSGGVKTLLTITLLLLLGLWNGSNSANAQNLLAAYPFSNESPVASATGTGLITTDINLSAGSLVYGTSHAATWAGVSGVPYVQGNSGWNALTAPGGKYFHFTIRRDDAVSIDLSSLQFYYRRTGSGPEHISVSINGSLVDSVMNTPADQTESISIDLNLTALDSAEVRIIGWGGGLGQFRLDDIQLYGSVSLGSTPLLAVSEESLFDINYVEGKGPSAGRRIDLSGFNLTPAAGTLTLTGDHEFLYSADSLTYQSSLSIPYVDGTVSQPVYVRLQEGLAEGSYTNRTTLLEGGGADSLILSFNGMVLPAFTLPYENSFRSLVEYQLAVDQGFIATANDIRETADPYLKIDSQQYLQTPALNVQAVDFIQMRMDLQQFGGSLEQKLAVLISADGGATFDTLATHLVPDAFETIRTDADLTGVYNTDQMVLRFQMTSGSGSVRFRDLKLRLQYRTSQLSRTPGYRLLSAPVEGSRLSHLLKENGVFTQCFLEADRVGEACDEQENGENVYFYNTVTNLWDPAIHISQELEMGTGVLVYFFDMMPDGITPGFPEELRMSGYEPNSDVTPALHQDPGGFTLLGNPFGSAIRFGDLIGYDFRNQVYVYDHAYSGSLEEGDLDGGAGGGGWRIYNGSVGSLTGGILAPYQGFFVVNKDTVESPNIRFPLSAKTDGGTLYNDPAAELSYMQLTAVTNDQLVSDLWLTFGPDGSVTRNQNDMNSLEPLDYRAHAQLTVPLNGERMSIKHLPAEELPLAIPISLQTWEPDPVDHQQNYVAQEGSARLLWPVLHQLPDEWRVTLHDSVTGETIDLREQGEYSFEILADHRSSDNLDNTGSPDTKSYHLGIHRTIGLQKNETRFEIRITEQPTSIDTDAGAGASTETNGEYAREFQLYPNYPNPFNPLTTLSFSLPEPSEVSVELFDPAGRMIKAVQKGVFTAGLHSLQLDASDLSAGLYFYRVRSSFGFRTGTFTFVK